MRKMVVGITVWSLLATAMFAQHRASLPSEPIEKEIVMVHPDGSSITVGDSKTLVVLEDVGLRVDGEHDGRVVGTLVAKVNGEWVPVELTSTNALAR